VVNDRHLKKRPMIFTTNKPLTEWGKVLHDEDMAAAILDRVLERGRFIHLDGPSGRTRHLNLQEVLPSSADRARISGIDVPEFPEPTLANIRDHFNGQPGHELTSAMPRGNNYVVTDVRIATADILWPGTRVNQQFARLVNGHPVYLYCVTNHCDICFAY